jgi:small subunit ribosomal protein S7e
MEVQKKPSLIFARSKSNKNANYSAIETQTGTALQEIVAQLDGDNKKLGSFLEINKVVEIPNGKEKPSALIYLSHRSHKVLLTPLYKKLVSELEKKLKTTVLLVAGRSIHSRWVKKNRTQKRPFSRTLTSVQEALLTELLLPGVIISDRVRVRLDGSQVRKVTLDKTEQHFLEERTQAIKNAYKKLTTRDIEIEFDKEPTFYVLKQGEKQK